MTDIEILEKYPNSSVSETIIGPTPDGGDFSVLFFMDKNGNACKKDDAVRTTVYIYKRSGERINLLVAEC